MKTNHTKMGCLCSCWIYLGLIVILLLLVPGQDSYSVIDEHPGHSAELQLTDARDNLIRQSSWAQTLESQLWIPIVLHHDPPLCNGDFETGDWTCWEHGGELDHRPDLPGSGYSGSYAAELGSGSYPCSRWGVPVGEAWISQTFMVPECTHPMLSWWYRIWSHDILDDGKRDSLDVYINGQRIKRYGNEDWTEPSCSATWISDWQKGTYDLALYEGQEVILSFHNVNRDDRQYNTWSYIDHIYVTCEP